jgi:hypothetical protein
MDTEGQVLGSSELISANVPLSPINALREPIKLTGPGADMLSPG